MHFLLLTFTAEVTSLSESSHGEVGDNREKWGDFWEKSIAINRNIVSQPRYIFFTRKKDLYNTNMSYYNLCGIGSQHSNISKGKGGGGGDFSFRKLAGRSGETSGRSKL
jgi:hypothetical protein